MKKNDSINLDITNYGCNAEGVAKSDGQVVFVPYSLLGENIDATIINDKSKFLICKATNINTKSEFRIDAPCPYFEKCGGCQLQHTTYQNALNIKRQIVQNAIKSIGKIDFEIPQVIASPNQFHYRNKIAMPIDPKTKSLGMYRLNTHSIIPVGNCLLQKNNINKLISVFNSYLKQTKLSIFDESTKKGVLKSLVAREIADKLLITIVINSSTLDDSDLLLSILQQNFTNFGLSLNINKLCNNVILSNNFVNIYGDCEAEITENNISYTINNQSFLQVNDEIKSQIYQKIFNQIDNDIVIDAYSGAGLLSAMMSKHAKAVYGIEIVKPATELANKLKAENNIVNLTNINGDCSIELSKLVNSFSEKEKQNTTIVLDPPRKGCDKNVLSTIIDCKMKKIIYMSCDPSTLARDLNILSKSYKIKSIESFDMFPQTKHVETLAILEL